MKIGAFGVKMKKNVPQRKNKSQNRFFVNKIVQNFWGPASISIRAKIKK